MLLVRFVSMLRSLACSACCEGRCWSCMDIILTQRRSPVFRTQPWDGLAFVLWSEGSPVFYVIDRRLYKREDSVSLVRHLEMGNAA